MGKISTSINGKTTISGVIGYPLKYTLSPSFHNSALKEYLIDSVYLPFIIEEKNIKAGIMGFKAYDNIVGLNVTNPHKKAVIPFMDDIDDDAKNIGSVNTIKFIDGKMIGYSTDGDGFLMSLAENGIAVKDKAIIILGSGGAARAIVAACIKGQANKIIVVSRTKQGEGTRYFDNINTDISFVSYDELSNKAIKDADMIVNCTPIGMQGKIDVLPIDISLLKEGGCFYDLNYNSRLELPGNLKEKQIKTIDGKLMLLCQAALSFNIFYDFRIKHQFIMDFLHKTGH